MKNTLYLITLLFVFPFLVWGQSTDQNYIKSTTYQQPYTWSEVQAGIPQDDMIETVTYFDGLGRTIETVSQRAGGDREDLITPVYYDAKGRNYRDWLPLPVTGNPDGEYYEGSGGNTITEELVTYYKAKFYDDFVQGITTDDNENPYNFTVYENSPLDRVLKQAAPGSDWKSTGTNTIRFEYDSNASNEVRDFSVTYTSGYSDPDIVYNGYYTANELLKNITKDENWQSSDGNDKTVQEFVDKQGRTVLKRTFNNSVAHDTYYVYDDDGKLVYVLSPEGADQIIDGSSLDTDYEDILDGLCYQYVYDNRGRLAEKKLPGKGWEYILYDKLDRPTLTQDKVLRDDGNKWLFTKYDHFDRVAYTGILSGYTRSQATDSLKVSSSIPLSETVYTSGNTIDGTTIYYTNSAFPYSNIKVLTVNYYDTYIDLGNLSSPPSSNHYGTTITTNVKGLPTVTKVRLLDGLYDSPPKQYWKTTVTGYDVKGRPIYVEAENPNFLNTEDLVESLLDFTGKPLETRSVHTLTGTNPLSLTTFDYYTYDHMGRQVSHYQVIDQDPVQRISVSEYDELGQLVQKEVGGETFLGGYTDITKADITYDGNITKDSNTTAWDSGVKTRGEILEDGGVTFDAAQTDKVVRIGLKKTTSLGTGWDSYDYAIHLLQTGHINLVINGNLNTTSVGTYVVGDTFTVERIGTSIYYKKNGGNLTTPVTDSSGDTMYGKASMYSSYAEADAFGLFGATLDKELQDVDYTYNVRGWLKNINDIENLSFSNTDLFNFRINYKIVEGNTNGTELYNGNIAQTLWKTKNTDTKIRGYNYYYDDLNRIDEARSYEGTTLAGMTSATDTHTLGGIAYDLNGNLESLVRLGTDIANNPADAWDNLNYDYDQYSNQLLNVTENSTTGYKDDGFYDGNNHITTHVPDYVYDDNGNMYIDRNKSISDIDYNHLNLPELITVTGTNSGTIQYIYDATGVKYMKVVDDGTNTNTTIYTGNYIYLDGELQFFNHPEGYITPYTEVVKGLGGGGTTYSYFNYVFQYQDHLGNVRLSYSDVDKNGAIATSEIIEESNYYPFGLKQKGYNYNVSGGNSIAQNYKYNGKELNYELGLDWYDFGARNYDPALGRWMNLDPLAEQMRRYSPYNYAFDNPIFFIDPDGMSPVANVAVKAPTDIYVNENGEFLGTDGAETKDVRVVSQDTWDSVGGQEGAQTIEGTAALQKSENSTLLNGTSKSQPGYQKGISISDTAKGEIEAAGGEVGEATLVNNSESSAFIRPESNVTEGPGATNTNGAYTPQEVKPGESVYGLVDGVKTSMYSDAVFKLVDGNKATIGSGGKVSITSYGGVKGFGGAMTIGGWSTKEFPKLRSVNIGNNKLNKQQTSLGGSKRFGEWK